MTTVSAREYDLEKRLRNCGAEKQRLRRVIREVLIDGCRWCYGENHDWDDDPTRHPPHPLMGRCIKPALDRPCPKCAPYRRLLRMPKR